MVERFAAVLVPTGLVGEGAMNAWIDSPCGCKPQAILVRLNDPWSTMVVPPVEMCRQIADGECGTPLRETIRDLMLAGF